MEHSIIIEQVISLRALHFLRMNQLKTGNEGEQYEMSKSDKVIRFGNGSM